MAKSRSWGRSAGRRIVYHSVSVQKRKRRRLHTAAAAGPAGIGATAGVISALSVISLRRNGISTTSTIPTARLPAPSSVKSFAYPALVATAVVPVGSGIVPEKSPAKSDARPGSLRDLLRSAIGGPNTPGPLLK